MTRSHANPFSNGEIYFQYGGGVSRRPLAGLFSSFSCGLLCLHHVSCVKFRMNIPLSCVVYIQVGQLFGPKNQNTFRVFSLNVFTFFYPEGILLKVCSFIYILEFIKTTQSFSSLVFFVFNVVVGMIARCRKKIIFYKESSSLC